MRCQMRRILAGLHRVQNRTTQRLEFQSRRALTQGDLGRDDTPVLPQDKLAEHEAK